MLHQRNTKSMIILIFLVGNLQSQFVWTQMPGILEFDKNTPQRSLPLKFNPQTSTRHKYSIWGWFKSNGQNPAISNIITLKQDSGDLLYINYDLNPAPLDTTKNQTFSLVFLIQKGLVQGRSEMMIEGFVNLLRTDSWSFFGISADYENGTFVIFLKAFDGINTPLTKKFDANFPGFQLDQNAQLIVGGVDSNSYFDSVSGFLGSIANIEMALFFTDNLSFMWSGYMLEDSRDSDGVILEFLFDIYDKKEGLISHGAINDEFQVIGDFIPLFKVDQNRLGGRFNSNSNILIKNVNLRNSDSNIKTIAFLFHFLYNDNLPDYFLIVSRGEQEKNGFLQIWLEKKNGGRVLKMSITGQDKKQLVWEGNTIFNNNQIYYFILGFSQSIGNSAGVIYIDNKGGNDFSLLSDSSNFDFSPKDISLFTPQNNIVQNNGDFNQTTGFNGYMDLYRFMILNSGSAAIQFLNYNTSKSIKNYLDNSNNPQDRYCLLRSSFYEKPGCFLCGNSIVFNDSANKNNRQCLNYCPYGYKNAFTDVCVECVIRDCAEIQSTEWNLQKVTNDKWIIKPSRPILTPNIDYKNLFKISLDGEIDSFNSFNYSTIPNYEKQEVQVDFDFKENIKNENLVLTTNQIKENPLYDVNRNLIYKDSNKIKIDRVCFVTPLKKRGLRSLAYVILLLFAISFVFMVLVTIICYNKIFDLLGLWKFLLHQWMKLQLVAFFSVLGIYMPCCLREFLHTLYWFAVGWDHRLRDWINRINNSTAFHDSVYKPISINFDYESVRAFILHNMGVWFIVHLCILLFYILIKIWDCCSNSTKRNFMFKLVLLMEFFLLIVGFLLIHMQIFVFASLNWKNAEFSHGYFTFCFILSVVYIVVFASFWIFAASVLFPDSSYLAKPTNYDKLYFFFAGYRKTRGARVYDLLVVLIHFVIGLMFGLVYNQPLAQIIVILCMMVLWVLITLIIRPWNSLLLNIFDILSQLLIMAVVIIFLIFQIWDKGGCEECGDREGRICWLIVFFLFFALILPLLILMIQALIESCKKRVYRNVTEVNRYFREENSDYYDEDNRILGGKIVNEVKTNGAMVGMMGDHNNTSYMSRRDISQNISHNISRNNVSNNNMYDEKIINKNYYEDNFVTANSRMQDGFERNNYVNANYIETKNERMARNEDINKNFSHTNIYETVTGADIIRPDSADEEDLQPSLIDALNIKKNNKEDDLSELNLTKMQLERRKNEFYQNNYRTENNNSHSNFDGFGNKFTRKTFEEDFNGTTFRNILNDDEIDHDIFNDKKIHNENIFEGERPIQTISKKHITYEITKKNRKQLEDF